MSSGLLARKKYLKAPRTLAFSAGGSDSLQISGRFNQLNFSLRGTVTRSGTGAVAGKDALENIQKLRVNSSIYGTIYDITGAEAYYWSRCKFNSAAFTTTGTGTTVANVGFEFTLPICCQRGETLTITVEWASALTTAGTLITAYGGILSIGAELIPTDPEIITAMKHQVVGASGVIGASSSYPQPNIPVVDGFALSGAIIQVNTTARGTYTNALSTIQLTNGVGNYIMDENAVMLRHIFGLEIMGTLPTGAYVLQFRPFLHNAETILQLGNGAVALTAGSEIAYEYILVRSLNKAVAIPEGMQYNSSEENVVPTQQNTSPVNQLQPVGGGTGLSPTHGGGAGIINAGVGLQQMVAVPSR